MKNIAKAILISLMGLALVTGCGCSNTKKDNKPNTGVDAKEQEKLKSEINADGTLKEEVNDNKGVVKEQTVEGITLTKTNFVSTAYTTTITVVAKNNTSNDITLEYFEVYLYDKNGKNVLGDGEFAVASVFGTIKANEEKTLTMNIDRNLNEVESIEYKMVKE